MERKTFDAIVVGELNVDHILVHVRFPEYEREHLAKDMRFTIGSSSAITAHNLAALGSNVGFIGKVEADSFGDFMIQQLQIGGVDCSGIIKDDKLKTGATIINANHGKKALLTYMTAMASHTIEDIDWELVANARHLHIGSYYLQAGLKSSVPELFEKAHALGLTTSLDTNWDPEEKWGIELYDALKHTDIFLPNETEAVHITQLDNINDAIDHLRNIVPFIAVKCGKKGVIGVNDNEYYHLAAFPVTAVEPSGAGDSFNAGFMHKYINGKGLRECLRFGNACGALAVTETGGTSAFRSKANLTADLEAILNTQSINSPIIT